VPVPDPANPTSGSFLPTLAWSPVPGAISYDIHVEESDGDEHTISDVPTHAFTPSKMTGIGIFHLEARANFPTSSGPDVHGPYSTLMAFARTIPEPGGAMSDIAADRVLLWWNPRMGAKEYRVQISTRPDFATVVENVTTQAPNHAPYLLQRDYVDGGRLFWRVAALDADANLGDFSPVGEFGIAQTLRLRTLGTPNKGRKAPFTVIATAKFTGVPGVRVKIWGAGLTARSAKTNASGRVTFNIKPRRKGTIYVRATKIGFKTATTKVAVRR